MCESSTVTPSKAGGNCAYASPWSKPVAASSDSRLTIILRQVRMTTRAGAREDEITIVLITQELCAARFNAREHRMSITRYLLKSLMADILSFLVGT